MRRFNRLQLTARAKTRTAGFEEAVMAEARPVNETIYEISDEEYLAILTKHTPGLGDAVAAVAQPVAKAIDAILGTKVAECGGCKARQAWLNQWRPFSGQDDPVG